MRNLPDGRVELLADGPADAVDAFLADVRDRMASCISVEDVAEREPDDALDGFRIVG